MPVVTRSMKQMRITRFSCQAEHANFRLCRGHIQRLECTVDADEQKRRGRMERRFGTDS